MVSGQTGRGRREFYRRSDGPGLCGLIGGLHGNGETNYRQIRCPSNHCHNYVSGRHRPVDLRRSILEDLGESVFAFSSSAQPNVLVTNSGFLEHHHRPIPLERRSGGRTGHHPRQLSFFSQAGHRNFPGRGNFKSKLDRMAGAGDGCHLHFCGS